ncbi:MAG: hypothetical protein ACK4RM_01620 [Flavobacterium sp.]
MENKFNNVEKSIASQKLQLINGEFNPNDAKNIILSLINSKIQYHQLEIFSMQERFGIEATHSINRIEELKLTTRDVKEIIKEAESLGLKLKVTSIVEIHPVL